MEDYIGILKELASEMYDEVWSYFDRYWGKLSPRELGRALDYAAANAAYRYLIREGLEFGIVSEEWPTEKRISYPVLIIDPVDGTNNISRGIRFSSISLSIALKDNIGSIVAGLVMDLFSRDVYWAVKGKGAFLNNSEIRVSAPTNMKDLFVSVVIDKSIVKHNLVDFLGKVKVLRFFGSSALELSLVASGKLDGFIDLRDKLRVFDFAPGYLLVKEAGGHMYIRQNGSGKLSIRKVGGYRIVASSTKWFLDKIVSLIE